MAVNLVWKCWLGMKVFLLILLWLLGVNILKNSHRILTAQELLLKSFAKKAIFGRKDRFGTNVFQVRYKLKMQMVICGIRKLSSLKD